MAIRWETLPVLEVKSGRRGRGLPGIATFDAKFKVKRKLLVGRPTNRYEWFTFSPTKPKLTLKKSSANVKVWRPPS
jgi:hypothetical protein